MQRNYKKCFTAIIRHGERADWTPGAVVHNSIDASLTENGF